MIQPHPFPANQGYRMPAEWELHEATWLVWPGSTETWTGTHLRKVEEIYLSILEALLPGEKVHLLVRDQKEAHHVQQRLQGRVPNLSSLIFHHAQVSDVWIRDFGPTFLKQASGEKAWCKWRFNAWGNKYPELTQDDSIFRHHASWISHPFFPAEFVLEGGSIEVNGAGLCLTTEECLLNTNRNPHLSKSEIEENLKHYLGVQEVLWLKRGIIGDDTDGHIDDLARFVDDQTIVTCVENDQEDANATILEENWMRLKQYSKERGHAFNVIRLPMPGKIFSENGDRLPASYANFYIANQVVLLPVFDHPHDKPVLELFEELFPSRKVIPLDCRSLIHGLGALHCVTQQEPA